MGRNRPDVVSPGFNTPIYRKKWPKEFVAEFVTSCYEEKNKTREQT